MRRLLLSLLALVFCLLSLESFAQNTCASPTVIGTIPYASPTSILNRHTTCNKGDDYDQNDACGNLYIRSDDYVYRFTAPANTNCISIALSAAVPIGGNSAPGVFLFDGCPDQPTTNCVAQGVNALSGSGTKNVNIYNVPIVAGGTYFLVVASDTGCYPYTLNITKGTCPAVQDTVGRGCNDAKEITTLPYVTTNKNFTTCGKGRTYNTGNPCESYYMDGEAFTFKYVSPIDQCATITVNTDSQYGSLYVVENCPTGGSGECISSVLGSYNGVMTQYVTFEAGKEYYFIVSSYNTLDSCQNFDIKVTNLPPGGRTCADAITVTNPTYMPYQSTRCKGNDYTPAQVCGSNYMGGNEVVYKYTSPGNECLSATLFNVTSYTGLYIMSACPGTPGAYCLAKDSAYYTFTPTYGIMKSIDAEAEITTPGDYYILVSNQYAFAGYDTDFDIRIAANPAIDEGATCETPYKVESLNFKNTGYNTSCKGADYRGATACSGMGNRGNDVVFEINSDRNGCAKIIASNISSRAGIYLVDACPDDSSAACLNSALCDNYGCDSVGMEYTFEKNKKYYLIVSAAAGFASVGFDLEIRPYAENDDTCLVCSEYVCKACKNISYELGTLEGWDGYEGQYFNPKQFYGMNPGMVNDQNSRHTIVSAGSYDPIVGKDLPVVSPYGGNYAARLGNSLTGAEAEVLRYTYTVDSSTNNFYYYYAVVLQDGGHAAADQPFFQTNVFVDSSEVITCGLYEVSAAANVPGFQPVKGLYGVNWKNWALVSIPLINYVGKQVTIEFTTKDCSQGGHYGYGYIDAFCGKAEILKADKEGRPIQVSGNVGFLCKDSTITMTAPGGYAKYNWANGDTGQTINVNKAGIYDVTVTSVSGCTAIIRTEIKEAADPQANFSFEQPCAGTGVGFKDISLSTDTFNIASWSWDFGDGSSSNQKNPSHSFSGPGTYEVKLKVATKANCVDETKQTIVVKPPVPIPAIGAIDSILICTKDSIKLFSNEIPNSTIKWSGPKGFTSTERSPSIPNADTAMSGMYIITMKYGDCDNASDTTWVTVLPFPKFSVSKDTNVCFSYSGIPLKATGGETYDWSPPYKLNQTSGPQVFTTTDTTMTYTVVISNAICPDSTMKVKITVDDYEQALASDHNLSACIGDTVVAHATAVPDDHIEWTKFGGGISKDSLVMNTLTAAQERYYVVKSYLGPNRYCQFGSDSVYINVNPLPTPIVSPATNIICYNSVGTATVSGADTYEWKSNGAVESVTNQISKQLTSTTNYDITAWSDSGCVGKTTYTIQVKPDFKVNLGADKIACVGDTLYLSLIAPDFNQQTAAFTWSDGSNDTTLMVTQSADYWVRVDNNGCIKYDTVHVEFQSPASFSIGVDDTICSNDSVLIDLSGVNGSVTWTDGFASPTRYLKDPGGIYGVVVVIGTCTLTDSITITSQAMHSVNIGPDVTQCLGSTVTMQSPNPTEQNVWIDGNNTAATPGYSISSAGTHNVILHVTIGECTTSDTAIVTIETPPPFTLGPDSTVCEDIPVLLNANLLNASAYNWNVPGHPTDTLTVYQPGNYNVTINWGTCIIRDTIRIFHDQIPVFSLGADLTRCNGQTATFGTTITGNSFIWSTGATSPSITVTKTDDYRLTVSRGKCSYEDIARANFQSPPVVDLGDDFVICDQLDTVLRATQNGATYQWNNGSNSDTLVVTATGVYSVVVTQGPCVSNDAIEITVQPLHTVSVPQDQILCFGVTADLKATTNATSPQYLWNTGDVSDEITVSTSGIYSVQVTSGVCVASDSVTMTFVNPPTVDLGDDVLLCGGESRVLDASYPGSNYLWNTGETTATITVSTTGQYFVQASIGPCHDEDTVYYEFKTPPQLKLMPDAEICTKEMVTITGVIPPGLNYYWNTGETTATIEAFGEGEYILTVTDAPCVVSDTFNLVVHPLPLVNLRDTTVCPTDSAYFNAYCDSCTYLWSFGSTEPDFWAYPGQLASIVVTSNHGCEWNQTVHAYEDKDCPEEIYIPNAFTPNNDGVNDRFQIVVGNVKLHEVLIYNRWGELLYRFTEPEQGWDGLYKGELVAQGIYDVRVVYSTIYRVKKAISVRLSVLK